MWMGAWRKRQNAHSHKETALIYQSNPPSFREKEHEIAQNDLQNGTQSDEHGAQGSLHLACKVESPFEYSLKKKKIPNMKREKNAFVSSKDRSLAEGGTFLEDITEVLNGRMESL